MTIQECQDLQTRAKAAGWLLREIENCEEQIQRLEKNPQSGVRIRVTNPDSFSSLHHAPTTTIQDPDDCAVILEILKRALEQQREAFAALEMPSEATATTERRPPDYHELVDELEDRFWIEVHNQEVTNDQGGGSLELVNYRREASSTVTGDTGEELWESAFYEILRQVEVDSATLEDLDEQLRRDASATFAVDLDKPMYAKLLRTLLAGCLKVESFTSSAGVYHLVARREDWTLDLRGASITTLTQRVQAEVVKRENAKKEEGA